MNRAAKKSLFNKIEPPRSGGKMFWKTCKPLFSEKTNIEERILLVEDDIVASDEIKIASIFNKYFSCITESLDIYRWNDLYVTSTENKVLRCINKYASHPSILKIKSFFKSNSGFSFSHVETLEVRKLISDLDCSKKTSGDIPTKIIKLAIDNCYIELTDCINTSIDNCIFPQSLKCADVSPIHTKDSTTDKANYRPISILPTLSKIFERVLFNQITTYCQSIFSKHLCGFRKAYSTQYSLINLLKNFQECLDKGGVIGTILMDLSKAYDCLPHDLLIAKLEAYGFDNNSLHLLYNYLTTRKQRVNIGSYFSEWLAILIGVPQGSILGPILFNLFLNDLFLFIEETQICNFADDNTVYSCEKTIEQVALKLEHDIPRVLNWLKYNSMVANPAKFQVMFLGIKQKPRLCININGNYLPASDKVKLLGVTIDCKLNFNSHVENLCKRSNQKINALLRIRKYLSPEKTRLLCNAYIISQFKYCPLIWTFCSKKANIRTKKVQKRMLRLVLGDFTASLEELLEISESTTIHIQNLQSLMTEVYKCLNRINPEFMWEMFQMKNIPYKLRISSLLILPQISSSNYGINSIKFRGSILWNSVPDYIKSSSTLAKFKVNIKEWQGQLCNCRICKI